MHRTLCCRSAFSFLFPIEAYGRRKGPRCAKHTVCIFFATGISVFGYDPVALYIAHLNSENTIDDDDNASRVVFLRSRCKEPIQRPNQPETFKRRTITYKKLINLRFRGWSHATSARSATRACTNNPLNTEDRGTICSFSSAVLSTLYTSIPVSYHT